MAQPPGGGQEQTAPFKPFILGRYNVLLPLGEGGMGDTGRLVGHSLDNQRLE